jgi:hypothetical protein
MDKEVKDGLAVRRKMVILEYARLCGNVAKACREFEITRSSFYKCWRAFSKSVLKHGLDSMNRLCAPG